MIQTISEGYDRWDTLVFDNKDWGNLHLPMEFTFNGKAKVSDTIWPFAPPHPHQPDDRSHQDRPRHPGIHQPQPPSTPQTTLARKPHRRTQELAYPEAVRRLDRKVPRREKRPYQATQTAQAHRTMEHDDPPSTPA